MSVQPNPFEDVGQHSRAAYAEQQAAIDAVRARQMAQKGPTVFLPFGKQQPMQKYVGMDVIPMRPNKCIDMPEQILLNPMPGAHYGWVKKDDPATKGKLRSHQFEAVYIDELKPDNDAEISVQDIMTEQGVAKQLVLWHNLMLVMIPERSYVQHYEMPALSSAVRMTQHQEAFRNFQMAGVGKTTIAGDESHAPYQTQQDNGGFKDLRGKADVDFSVKFG